MKRPVTKLTLDQEKQIRRAFFYEHRPPEVICAEWNIGQDRLRRIIGGPLRANSTRIEQLWT